MSKTYGKLRQVVITYDLPRTPGSANGFIQKASRCRLIGRNLLYFYGDKRFKDVDLDQYNGYATGATGLAVAHRAQLRPESERNVLRGTRPAPTKYHP